MFTYGRKDTKNAQATYNIFESHLRGHVLSPEHGYFWTGKNNDLLKFESNLRWMLKIIHILKYKYVSVGIFLRLEILFDPKHAGFGLRTWAQDKRYKTTFTKTLITC